MSGCEGVPFWGQREIAGVASNGIATQLYPNSVVARTFADTTTTYPPTAGGDIRRPTAGRISRLSITCDDVGGGVVEIWDVSGLDRGSSDNVNNDVELTDAYLTANGEMLDRRIVKESGSANADLVAAVNDIVFNKGLAIRYVGSGSVFISPHVFAGFNIAYVAAP